MFKNNKMVTRGRQRAGAAGALFAPALLARFEMAALAELGFRLDLERCAATGTVEALIYVSPKSGRAVSAAAGAPWRERLLALPAFLRAPSPEDPPTARDLADAFRLTGFFLERDVFGPRGLPLPDARRAFLGAAERGPGHPETTVS